MGGTSHDPSNKIRSSLNIKNPQNYLINAYKEKMCTIEIEDGRAAHRKPNNLIECRVVNHVKLEVTYTVPLNWTNLTLINIEDTLLYCFQDREPHSCRRYVLVHVLLVPSCTLPYTEYSCTCTANFFMYPSLNLIQLYIAQLVPLCPPPP